jgi:DNA-binding transcriptional MerR regulator
MVGLREVIRVRRRLWAGDGQSFPNPGKGRVADPPGTTGSGARQLSGNIYNGARMALTPGTKLGPYEIQSPLGAGGMGEVHRARDTRLSREVAIKVLPEAFARDADRLQRFEHEARVLSTVNHPNILAIHDVGAQGDVRYLVSELLEGQTLREKLSAGMLRLYTTDDIERRHFIRPMHGLGFSLREIGELIDLRTRKIDACESVRGLVKHKVAEMRGQLHQLQRLEAELVSDLHTCNKELKCRQRHKACACPVLEEVATK